MDEQMLSIADVAGLLGLSVSRVYQTYQGWREYGVRILRTGSRSRPKFYKSDILKMLEKGKD